MIDSYSGAKTQSAKKKGKRRGFSMNSSTVIHHNITCYCSSYNSVHTHSQEKQKENIKQIEPFDSYLTNCKLVWNKFNHYALYKQMSPNNP